MEIALNLPEADSSKINGLTVALIRATIPSYARMKYLILSQVEELAPGR
jgi:hypothetical protein